MSKVRPKKWLTLEHVEKHAFLLVGRKRQQATFDMFKKDAQKKYSM